MITLTPTPDYRYAFKLGMTGTDVAALQINLGVTVDGDFGVETESAVEKVQKDNGLVVDGIAGLETQKTLCRAFFGPVQKQYSLPGGILVSIANNESGFAIAAYSKHPSDNGYDLGALQRSLSPVATQDQIVDAYDLDSIGHWTGKTLRESHDRFSDPWAVDSWYVTNIAGGRKGRMAWQLAVLNHNYPFGAENIWKIGSIFKEPAKDTQPAQWVIDASGGRLSTPREWVVSYIDRATVYTRWSE
jgi:hypothetical protein